MSHDDLIFRYACRELLRKEEYTKIGSLLPFNKEYQEQFTEIELMNDLLISLTNDDCTNSWYLDNAYRKRTTPLLKKALIFLVAEKEKLNDLARSILKVNLRYNKEFNDELQEYILFNKKVDSVINDTEFLDLHFKLNSLHDKLFTGKVNNQEFYSTILKLYSKEINSSEKLQDIVTNQQNNYFAHNNVILPENLPTSPNSAKDKTRTNSKWKSFAATVVMLLGLTTSFYFGQRDNSPEGLYKKYYETFITNDFNRNAPNVLLNTAMYNYQAGNCKEAIKIFEKLEKENGYESLAKFYLGLSNMELKSFDEAISFFVDESLNNSEYKFIAQWYLALCFLKTNEPEMAKYVLIQLDQSDSKYSAQTKELLEKLN